MNTSIGIIILGMHRSGTSATTGMLRCLGVTLGNKLYTGHANINSKGYFEHSDIADTNEEALLAIESTWDDILPKTINWWQNEHLKVYASRILHFINRDFSNSEVWAVKDPRVCRLLPWWQETFKINDIRAKYILVIRPPQEVYESLKKRDGFSLEKSYFLWLLHYLDAEYWTRDLPRTFTTFEDLISDPVTIFSQIEKTLSIKFPISIDNAAPALSQFIDKDLIHYQKNVTPNNDLPTVALLANALYQQLLLATQDDKYAIDFSEIDSIRAKIDSIQKDFSPLLVEQLHNTYKIRSNLQLTMNKIIRSYSWIIGKPIRFIERIMGRDV